MVDASLAGNVADPRHVVARRISRRTSRRPALQLSDEVYRQLDKLGSS